MIILSSVSFSLPMHMKKSLALILLFLSLHGRGQSVFGCWYGDANVKTTGSANNYMMELILLPEKNYVSGILNYYFRNAFRSLPVKGDYDAANRRLTLYNVPMIYHGSFASFEVDCIMNLQATLRVAQAGSDLIGVFTSSPEYKNICPVINFSLRMNADISKKDSVLKALREFKETYQVWKPNPSDTEAVATIIQRKVTNYVIEREFTERQTEVSDEIEVESDTLKVDFYDNGEVDGDSISVFFNGKLMAFSQKLGTRPVHFDVVMDSLKKVNEISMFAENLGSIPPNTALMIINDGVRRHEVRLSSTLDKNATIRIKRKKDGIKTK